MFTPINHILSFPLRNVDDVNVLTKGIDYVATFSYDDDNEGRVANLREAGDISDAAGNKQYADLSEFPNEGEANVLYIAQDTWKMYTRDEATP